MVSSITSISPLDPSAAASTRAGLRAPGKDLRALAKRAGHKVVAVFTETAERAKVLALARAREIDAILAPNSADGAAAPRTSSRRWTTCTAGKSASWLRLA